MEQAAPRPLDRTASLQRAREAKRLKREQKKDKAARLHEYRWKNKAGLKERLENRLAKVPAEEGGTAVLEGVEAPNGDGAREMDAEQSVGVAGEHTQQGDTEKQE